MNDDAKCRYASPTASRFDGKTTIAWLKGPGDDPVERRLPQIDASYWAKDDQSYVGKYDLFAAINGTHAEPAQ